ncbi:MAG TPA: sugar phosphate isomerase/epimerase family protein [Terriglobales bacterium]|nr:sugar phosphate isomerase/epimerase family protein [Terriglobales bacterium]
MKTQTTRRDFLNGLALSLGAVGSCFLPSLSHATAASLPSIKFPSEPRQRISVSSYPFREFIAGDRHKSGNPTIDLKDFAAHVVERFNVNKIEPWTHHFPSTDPKYLEEFRNAVEKAGAAIANLAVDGTDSAYAADRDERERAIAYSRKWIDVAVALGSPSVRKNIARAKDSKPDVKRLAESLRRVAEYASTRNVVVHLENDDLVSEDPFFLVQVIKKVNSPWLRALPDFGNTLDGHEENYAYRAVDAMFAYSYAICHVKDSIGGDQGKVTHVDLARTFEILRHHSYKGYCSIEYDAPGDPYKPTAMLVDTIVKYLS